MMVSRKNKITPLQIVVLLLVTVVYVGGGIVIYLFLNPDKMVQVNDSKLGICYDMFEVVSKEHPEMILFDFDITTGENGTGSMRAEFKYVAEKVSEDADWIALAKDIRDSMVAYLEANPQHDLVKHKYQITLDFPAITYCNVVEGEYAGLFFGDVSYSNITNTMTAQAFISGIASAGDFQVLHVIAPDQLLSSETDLKGLSEVSSLQRVEVQLAGMDASVENVLKQWMK